MRIKFILSHPVQYQTPFINFLVKKGLDIEVCYRCNISNAKYFDVGFKKKIKWEFDLTKGHKHKFLQFIGPNKIGKYFPKYKVWTALTLRGGI